ncbi:hypothetical protein E3N88_37819 [Mikania micrantha]|uniref:Uncharacterized protein n=1 Tax=Mikania micrantha TaxID=192012 RepID=A0A5N6LUI7_9ASTR|nr:hypothetical protein E3N88_37819 [Mikania micrantha]
MAGQEAHHPPRMSCLDRISPQGQLLTFTPARHPHHQSNSLIAKEANPTQPSLTLHSDPLDILITKSPNYPSPCLVKGLHEGSEGSYRLDLGLMGPNQKRGKDTYQHKRRRRLGKGVGGGCIKKGKPER